MKWFSRIRIASTGQTASRVSEPDIPLDSECAVRRLESELVETDTRAFGRTRPPTPSIVAEFLKDRGRAG